MSSRNAKSNGEISCVTWLTASERIFRKWCLGRFKQRDETDDASTKSLRVELNEILYLPAVLRLSTLCADGRAHASASDFWSGLPKANRSVMIQTNLRKADRPNCSRARNFDGSTERI
jgi:hypothetical protein